MAAQAPYTTYLENYVDGARDDVLNAKRERNGFSGCKGSEKKDVKGCSWPLEKDAPEELSVQPIHVNWLRRQWWEITGQPSHQTNRERIVSLPQELQRLLGSLRDLDDRTAELMAGAREKVQKLLHLSSQSGKKAQDGEAKKIEALRRDVEERYELVTQWSHEKVRLAVLAYEMIDINMFNLDRDILKFQEELAAQNSLPPDLSSLEKGLMAGDLSYEMMQQQQAASLQASIRPPKVSRGKDAKRKSSVRTEKVDPFKHLQIDDNVAARISPPSAEADEWIVCKVISMSDDKHYFDLLDEHAGEDEINTHRLTRLNVIPLPKPDSRHAIQTFPPGTFVLAIFPGTTAFYRAAVVATPKRQKSALVGDYLLEFDDDIEDGIIMQRAVSIDQVVALPFDFKLG